jgi:acyl-CoA thioester hydrolase
MPPFVHRLRVRYHECDQQGIVFNANHFAYFDVVLTELWRAAFGSYGAMVASGADVQVGGQRRRVVRSSEPPTGAGPPPRLRAGPV